MLKTVSHLMILTAFALIATSLAIAENDQSDSPVDSILVFDASGSMWARMDGVEKIVVARDVVSDLLGSLPPEHRIGLIAYGHNRKGDCSDIEMLAPVGTDHAEISEMVQSIVPKGMTPMTDAVIQAAEELKYTENEATVILVSDGEETCHDDPCAAAQRLSELGVGLTVHTIGFGLESAEAEAATEQLHCMAEETGGKFLLAKDAGELREALKEVSPDRAPENMNIKLRATDQDGGPTITEGLVWTVSHGSSGEPLYESEQPEGSASIEIERGVHDVSVVRDSDDASATGEISPDDDDSTLILPIVVEYEADLIAPDTAIAGETIHVEWEGPDEDSDYIAVFETDAGNRDDLHYTRTSKGNPLNLKMPEQAGTYEIRYILQSSKAKLATHTIEIGEVEARLSAPDSATAGETIQVEWDGPDYSNDYIAVFEVDAGNRDDLHYTRTSQGNPLNLKMPEEAGTYEIRYILQNSKTDLATRTIEVGEVRASLDTPASATAGETIQVEWDGPDYSNDYIAVFEVDAGNRDDLHYTRTSRGNPLNLKMPEQAGTYEIRYVLSSSRRDLDRKTIKVNPAN